MNSDSQKYIFDKNPDSAAKIQAVILAAGRGKRLMPFTADIPKCLVLVGGKPILYYQLRALELNGISYITIVIGYRGGKIREYLRKYFSHLNITLVSNKKYIATGPAYSLHLARNHMNGVMIQLMGDVVFHPCVISNLMEKMKKKSAICVRMGQCSDGGVGVEVKNSAIYSIGKNLNHRKIHGEFVGISILTNDFMRSLNISLKNSVKKNNNLLFVCDMFHKTIKKKGSKLYSYAIREPAIEIDFPKDIEYAEKNIIAKLPF